MAKLIMTQIHKTLAPLAAACLLALAAAPGWAASSATSSISDSVSTSVGSLSDSIQGSSKSSTGDKKVAAGDYKIIDIAAVPGKPGMAQLTLQAAATPAGQPAEEFQLLLPAATLAKTNLAAGGTVTAREHAYGLEFAVAQTSQAFFLVLRDEWFKELHSNPVVL